VADGAPGERVSVVSRIAEGDADAFHLVIPSMPGYGFSGKPTTAGWGPERIAPVLFQPMAAEDVAKAVGRVAVSAPVNGIVEIGGPQQFRFDEFIRPDAATTTVTSGRMSSTELILP
jgi:hypothetical protein